jgi:RimJ/RimL family protein N-acetyltransferase
MRIKSILPVSLALFLMAPAALWGTLQSDLFTVEPSGKLSVTLQGKTAFDAEWAAVDVKAEDIAFYCQLFADPLVMGGFAAGEPRTPEATEERIKTQWLPRFTQGHPHGGLTVFDDAQQRIGHIVAGGGEGKGVSEIAYSFVAEQWGKGYGSSIVGAIVNCWAPEVRRIGLNLTYSIDPAIAAKFCCFGGEPLSRLDATASLTNPGSWKILDKHGFKAARFKIPEEAEYILDLSDQEVTLAGMQDMINAQLHEQKIEPASRYLMIDPQGKERTVSLHERWKQPKYHFEKYVD